MPNAETANNMPVNRKARCRHLCGLYERSLASNTLFTSALGTESAHSWILNALLVINRI